MARVRDSTIKRQGANPGGTPKEERKCAEKD